MMASSKQTNATPTKSQIHSTPERSSIRKQPVRLVKQSPSPAQAHTPTQQLLPEAAPCTPIRNTSVTRTPTQKLMSEAAASTPERNASVTRTPTQKRMSKAASSTPLSNASVLRTPTQKRISEVTASTPSSNASVFRTPTRKHLPEAATGTPVRHVSAQRLSSELSPGQYVEETPSKKRKATALRVPRAQSPETLAKAARIQAQLQTLYPNPHIPLDHDSHFQLLCAVMMSAQVCYILPRTMFFAVIRWLLSACCYLPTPCRLKSHVSSSVSSYSSKG